MKLGVYVGSFDPVHKGHIEVVNYLIDNKYIDSCVIVPTLGYWNKNNQIDLSHRINMLNKYKSNKILIDNKNNHYKYTYQILDSLKNKYKSSSLYLIIGDDLIKDFNKWNNINKILKHKIIVMKRLNVDSYKYINRFKEKNNFIVVYNYATNNISSTKIRNDFYKLDKSELLKLIDEEVYNYILNNELYI